MKKYLNVSGIQHLRKQLSLKNYSNNKILPQIAATTDAAGGSQAHNMPLYLVDYMWKHVA